MHYLIFLELVTIISTLKFNMTKNKRIGIYVKWFKIDTVMKCLRFQKIPHGRNRYKILTLLDPEWAGEKRCFWINLTTITWKVNKLIVEKWLNLRNNFELKFERCLFGTS